MNSLNEVRTFHAFFDLQAQLKTVSTAPRPGKYDQSCQGDCMISLIRKESLLFALIPFLVSCKSHNAPLIESAAPSMAQKEGDIQQLDESTVHNGVSWQELSRQASSACNSGQFDRAIGLIQQSIRLAEKAKLKDIFILHLRCKLCQILEKAGRHDDALREARQDLARLGDYSQDWRKQIVAHRLYSVARDVFLSRKDLGAAREEIVKMGAIDERIMSPIALETLCRRIELIEIDFLRSDFTAVIANGEQIYRRLKSLQRTRTCEDFRLLICLGASYMQLGSRRTGDQLLREAQALAKECGCFSSEAFRNKVSSLKNGQEINQLLSGTN